MTRKILIVTCFSMIIIFTITASSFAQFQKGNTELTIAGGIVHSSGDQKYHTITSQTIITLTVGYGPFVSSHIQLGIQPTWLYIRETYTTYNWDFWGENYTEQKETDSDGILGMSFFTNINIPSQSQASPYLTVQYHIDDIMPEGGVTIGDLSSLSFGAGLRYFIVKKAAINSIAKYTLPLKDAKYKYKYLSLNIGLSIIL